MAANPANDYALELRQLHHDIDRLIGLANALSREPLRDEMSLSVQNARTLFGNLEARRARLGLSPEEDSVVELKMGRLRSQLMVPQSENG